jgi:membrane protease YdiL (CAAX protease family)
MDSSVPPVDPILPAELTVPAPPPPPPEPSALRKVFLGPQGLRAGWKYAIFMVVLFALIFLFSTLVVMVLGKPERHQPLQLKLQFAFEVFEAVAALLATGIMAKLIDKRKWGYFGLPLNRAFSSEFWTGAVLGFGALAFQLELMHLGGWFDFGTIVLHGSDVLRWGAFWGLFFLCTGFFEEGMLRGYPQRVLTNGMGFWPSALVLSTLFACLHLGNPGENKFGIFMVFVDGMTMCFSLWRTGSMWFAVGNHAAWDWAQTFFFGTPDSGMKPHGALFSPSFHGPALLSGGADGPEGSVLVLLSEVLIAVAIAIIYRHRKYPLLKDEAPVMETAPVESSPLITPPQTA